MLEAGRDIRRFPEALFAYRKNSIPSPGHDPSYIWRAQSYPCHPTAPEHDVLYFPCFTFFFVPPLSILILFRSELISSDRYFCETDDSAARASSGLLPRLSCSSSSSSRTTASAYFELSCGSTTTTASKSLE